MSLFSKRATIAIALATIGLLATGCRRDRIARCHQLAGKIEQVNAEIEEFTQTRQPQGSEAEPAQSVSTLEDEAPQLESLADRLESSAITIQQMRLGDEQLKEFQEKFARVYLDMSQSLKRRARATRNYLEAVEGDNEALKQQAIEKMKAAGQLATQAAQRSDRVAEAANKYCQSNE